MKKSTLLIIQIILTSLCFPIFLLYGQYLKPLHSFLFSMATYWILLILASVFILFKDINLTKEVKKYFSSIQKPKVASLNFIPILAVFFVAFLPVANEINCSLFILILIISLINGFLEEFFWRGLTVATFINNKIYLLLSITLFTAFHFAFILLPLTYHGGALSLVGGAAFMGLIWMICTKQTKNIIPSIAAHMLVNLLAFTGLFMENNMLL